MSKELSLDKVRKIHDTIMEYVKANTTGWIRFEIKLFKGGITSVKEEHGNEWQFKGE